MLYAYAIRLEPDDNDTLLVTCADLPEVTTFAANEADARRRATQAIQEAIAARIARREDIPPPRTAVGDAIIVLPLQTRLKARLWHELCRAGLRKADLARRLDWNGPQIDRLFDLDHETKQSQLRAAFNALGFEIEVGGIAVAPLDELTRLDVDELVKAVADPQRIWAELVRRDRMLQEGEREALFSAFRPPGQEIQPSQAQINAIMRFDRERDELRKAMDRFLDRCVPGRRKTRKVAAR
ncbi:MAG: hypothetical protein JWM77_2096 [Rhodospirillales bacterium]|nr:hypothetical protein [Rhodospirillales bacterium]